MSAGCILLLAFQLMKGIGKSTRHEENILETVIIYSFFPPVFGPSEYKRLVLFWFLRISSLMQLQFSLLSVSPSFCVPLKSVMLHLEYLLFITRSVRCFLAAVIVVHWCPPVGWLNFAGSPVPTQPLSPHLSIARGGGNQDEKVHALKIKTGRSLPIAAMDKTGMGWGKLISCQLKYSWMVRTKGKDFL